MLPGFLSLLAASRRRLVVVVLVPVPRSKESAVLRAKEAELRPPCRHGGFRAESDRAPVHIYHRQNPEEHEPLSSAFDGASPTSAIVAVDTNLDTSTLDTYRAPPAPLPYDVGLKVAENPDLEKSDIKTKTEGQQSPKVGEFESCEKGTLEDKPDEEDVCPICLEEYDEENPRSITKCEHHFHLCCILEWMERSDTCPVCDQITLIDEMYE